jgi:hypothetical protein
LYQPRENCKCARDPHEDEDCDSDLRANVQLRYASNCIAEDDDCRDNGGGGDDERIKEGENGDGEREPACEDGDGHQEDEDESEACACEEEAEHPSRDVLDQGEDIINIRGEINCAVLLVHLYFTDDPEGV